MQPVGHSVGVVDHFFVDGRFSFSCKFPVMNSLHGLFKPERDQYAQDDGSQFLQEFAPAVNWLRLVNFHRYVLLARGGQWGWSEIRTGRAVVGHQRLLRTFATTSVTASITASGLSSWMR